MSHGSLSEPEEEEEEEIDGEVEGEAAEEELEEEEGIVTVAKRSSFSFVLKTAPIVTVHRHVSLPGQARKRSGSSLRPKPGSPSLPCKDGDMFDLGIFQGSLRTHVPPSNRLQKRIKCVLCQNLPNALGGESCLTTCEF